MYTVFESIRVAFMALWANRMRSFLTILCVIVSIMAIIAVVSIIDGMNTYVQDEIVSEGTDVFTLERVNQLGILTNFDLFLKYQGNISFRGVECAIIYYAQVDSLGCHLKLR